VIAPTASEFSDFSKYFFQWWSLETWSRSRGSRDSSRDPFLRVLASVSKVSGHVSVCVLKASGVKTLNIVKTLFYKISIIQRFLFVFAGKKQTKHVGKMPEIWKNFKSEVITIFLKKVSRKCTNFEASSLGLGVFDDVSSLGRGVFDDVWVPVSSQNFNQVRVRDSKVTVSTTSLVLLNERFRSWIGYQGR